MSDRKIFVVGHKNPDTDSIVSAAGYAELLRLQGVPGVVAARQGEMWRETRYILDRFGVPLPVLIDDVRPHAADVMNTSPVAGKPSEPVYRVGQRMREKGLRALPVVDDDGKLLGMTSVEDLADMLLSGLDVDELNHVTLDIHSVVETLGGRLIVEARDRKLSDHIFVAALGLETLRNRVDPDAMVVMGDRVEAQRVAVQGGAGALVITSGMPVSDELIELARKHNVTIISSPHHTYNTVRLLNLSVPVSHVMRSDILTASPEDSLDDLRSKLARQRSIPVVDNGGCLVGVVSRTDLLNPMRHGVYLVDHNERAQTVDGLDEAELLGIVDHHRLADIQTATPIFFRNDIIGSTSTMIAGLFNESGIAIPPPIAGILLGGLVTDTVLFRSPTTTPRDRQVAEQLGKRAGVDVEAYAKDIFAVASDLSGRTPRQIITTDYKEFRIEDAPFAVSYLETVARQRVDEIRDELLAEMRALRAEKGYAALLLMIVDIVHAQTEILIEGMERAVAEALGQPLATPKSVMVGGVLSRKKSIIPILPSVARAWKARN